MSHFLLFQVSLCSMWLCWVSHFFIEMVRVSIMTITFFNTAFLVIVLSVTASSAVQPQLANSITFNSCYWLVELNKTTHKTLNRKWQQWQKTLVMRTTLGIQCIYSGCGIFFFLFQVFLCWQSHFFIEMVRVSIMTIIFLNTELLLL